MAADDLPRDKRRFPRVRVRMDVECTHGDGTQVATVEDLSEGGAFVSTVAPAPIGTALKLNLSVAGEGMAGDTLEGRVVRIVEVAGDPIPDHITGMGIEFRLTDEQRERLRSILVSHDPGPLDPEPET